MDIPLSYNRNNNRIIKREGNIIVGCPKQTIHYVGQIQIEGGKYLETFIGTTITIGKWSENERTNNIALILLFFYY